MTRVRRERPGSSWSPTRVRRSSAGLLGSHTGSHTGLRRAIDQDAGDVRVDAPPLARAGLQPAERAARAAGQGIALRAVTETNPDDDVPRRDPGGDRERAPGRMRELQPLEVAGVARAAAGLLAEDRELPAEDRLVLGRRAADPAPQAGVEPVV